MDTPYLPYHRSVVRGTELVCYWYTVERGVWWCETPEGKVVTFDTLAELQKFIEDEREKGNGRA